MKLAQGPIPLYHQLEQDLRTRIVAQEFAPGDVLPTEDSICKTYGVSRITVRRALDALIAQGLIIRKRGVGSFVAERREGVRSIRLAGSLDEFLSSANILISDVLSFRSCEPPEEVRSALGLEDGERASRLELVSKIKGEPVAYLEIYFPPFVARLLRPDDFGPGLPVIRTVERKLGEKVARAEQTIEADQAGDVAPHLQLKATDPVLHVTRVYYLPSGQPIEAAFVRYHPKRYRYAIDFVPDRAL